MRSPLLLKPLYLNGVILEYGAGERLVHARNRRQRCRPGFPGYPACLIDFASP